MNTDATQHAEQRLGLQAITGALRTNGKHKNNNETNTLSLQALTGALRTNGKHENNNRGQHPEALGTDWNTQNER